MGETYDVRVEGEISSDLIDTFHPQRVRVEDGSTVFRCVVADEPALFGVVARCETLGLRLVALNRTPRDPVGEAESRT